MNAEDDDAPPLAATCAVEYAAPLPEVCPICADERQWVGQHWTSLTELRAAGQQLRWSEPEPSRAEITTEPRVGSSRSSH